MEMLTMFPVLEIQLGQTPAVQHTQMQVCLHLTHSDAAMHLQSLFAHGCRRSRVPSPTAHPRRALDRLPTSARRSHTTHSFI